MSAAENEYHEPLISVVMSCYNEEETVQEAVKSILTQTFDRIEFIIIDDGSTDSTFNALQHLAQKDTRIRLAQNDQNLGLSASLNKGIKMSRSPFIARMDADDFSLPDRLALQYKFFQNNKDLDVVGTNAIMIKNGVEKISRVPLSNKDIHREKYRRTVLIHPTVMLRRELFDKYGYYDESLSWAEDKDLWLRWMGSVCFANIEEPLLRYKVKDQINLRIIYINHRVLIHNMIRRKELFANLHVIARSFLSHMKNWLVR